jgi:hypothetical protein
MEILVLQFLHLPLKAKKLIRGISSYQQSLFWQVIHPLLPPKERAVLNLNMTTFKKLPIIRPKIKKTIVRKKVIFYGQA